MTHKDLPALRRELLEAAVADTEGTIRGTDTKASIALVLHGLLFGGLLSLTKDLGERYTEHHSLFKIVVVALAAITGLAFVASVIQLVRCVSPAPAYTLPDTSGVKRGVFFITDRRTGPFRWEMPSAADIRQRVQSLDEHGIEQEWIAEALTLATIRQRKIRLVKSGLRLLMVEVLAAGAYLAVFGSAAI